MNQKFFKNVFRLWSQHAGTQIVTLSVLTATFSVVAFALCVSFNLNKILVDWGKSLKVITYFKSEPTETELAKIQSLVKTWNSVNEAKYVSKDAALENFKGEVGNYIPDFTQEADLENPLPASFEVSFEAGFLNSKNYSFLQEWIAKITELDFVDEVSYGQNWAQSYTNFMSGMLTAGWVVISVLVLGSLFIISNSIRASISSRREEIEILELVGATKSAIRLPYVIEGTLVGLLASVFGLLISFILFSWVKTIISQHISLGRMAQNLNYMDWKHLLVFCLVGAALGAISSYFISRQYNDGWAAIQRLY